MYFCDRKIKKMNMSRLDRAILLFAAVFFVSCAGAGDQEGKTSENQIDTPVVEEPVHPLAFLDTLSMTEGKIRSGQFFSKLLNDLGMTYSEAYELTAASDSIFDIKTMRIGNAYRAYYTKDTTQAQLACLVYDIDKVSSVIFECRPEHKVWIYDKPVESHKKYVDVTINSSLWNDMIAADAHPQLILSLSDIYAWTIDFFALQKGDRFKVLYSEKCCDGEVIAIDTVKYAVFTHAGVDYPAIRFDQKDGGNVWWNEKGESLKKAFLKAPLNYSRISSGFSYARKHPITRKVQPHTGVDYAAPAGTPVVTIGDGVVTSMKNEGAGGNTVRIKHNSVYRTAYLHLSKFAKGLKVGQRVVQGEVIGYVGSTGRSTGPHLDFRVWKNDTPINPLTMESPSAEPLKEENMTALQETLEAYIQECETIAQ